MLKGGDYGGAKSASLEYVELSKDTSDEVLPTDTNFYEELLHQIEDMVNLNIRILNDKEAIEKKRLEEEKLKRKEAKDKVRSWLMKYERDHQALKIPLWRHKLRGSVAPPPDMILRGKSLWRVLTRALILIYIRPFLHILNRKKATRLQEREFLERTLLLYAASCDHWMGKLVRIPLLSLDTEDLLDFDFHPRYTLKMFNYSNTRRVLQLKVRIQSIVHSITSSEIPLEIMDNLLCLLVEDGNYFKKSFLFECEKRRLEFDKLGATQFMSTPIDHGEVIQDPNVKLVGKVHIDITKSKMLIQNFLLVRYASTLTVYDHSLHS